MRPIPYAVPLALVWLLAFGPLSAAVPSPELQEVSRSGEKAILAKPGLQMTGARNPDLTIVEYFDYNCPYCKKVVPTFKQLLAEDKKPQSSTRIGRCWAIRRYMRPVVHWRRDGRTSTSSRTMRC
jgi:hypothetical protein